MSVKVSRPITTAVPHPRASRAAADACARPRPTLPPGRDSRGLRHKHFRPPMIARAPRDCWRPVSSPKPSLDAQVRA